MLDLDSYRTHSTLDIDFPADAHQRLATYRDQYLLPVKRLVRSVSQDVTVLGPDGTTRPRIGRDIERELLAWGLTESLLRRMGVQPLRAEPGRAGVYLLHSAIRHYTDDDPPPPWNDGVQVGPQHTPATILSRLHDDLGRDA